MPAQKPLISTISIFTFGYRNLSIQRIFSDVLNAYLYKNLYRKKTSRILGRWGQSRSISQFNKILINLLISNIAR
jgi:hypothetical protein